MNEHATLRAPPLTTPRGRAPARHPAYQALLFLAVVGIFTNAFALHVGAVNVSVERVIGLLLLPVLAFVLFSRATGLRSRNLVWLWFGWIVVLTASTALTGQIAAHLLPLLTACLPVAYLALFTLWPCDTGLLYRRLRILVWIMGPAGIVVFAATHLHLSASTFNYFVDVNGRVRLLVSEPNILGSTLAATLLAILPRIRLRWGDLLLFGLGIVVFMLAGSKAPIIAFVLGVVIFLACRAIAKGRNISGALLGPAWGALIGLAAVLALLPSAQTFYSTTMARPDAIASRQVINRVAIRRFEEAPIMGRGAGDFGLSDQSVLKLIGAEGKGQLWIGPMTVSILHDSGIVGLTVYLLFLAALLRHGYAMVRRGSLDHCGYMAAMISLVISSQATTVHLGAVFGIFAGLVAATPVSIWTGYRSHRVPRRRPQASKWAASA